MNKNAIQSFTQWAKIQLTSAIKQKAFEYGITENMIDESVSIVNGRVLSQVEQKQRETLINKVKEEGYTQVIEEVTYTWFNRFIALRFMEVNGYLPTRVRVFSDENNKFNPQILKEALTIELDNINRDLIIDYLDKNNTEELYKYLLITQCNELNKIIPVLFEKISNYSELLFPDNLLKKNSVIEHLVTDIPEEDWKDQVQILGWIYQFYIADKKDETFASKKTITKSTLAAVTQLFTPDWIVKYMVENSLGRLWLESNPHSLLKENMNYYIEDAKQNDEVQNKLDEIKYKNVNPEDIRIIEPCCGSGHILVYIFDLLYKIYEESGYKKSEIPGLILEKNIIGLDIDRRASQLAYFSLLMKARSVDSRFFNRGKLAKPKVFEIIDSQNILADDFVQLMKNNDFSNKNIETAKYLVSTFKHAKVIGSLLKVEKLDYKAFIEELKLKRKEGPLDLFSSHLYNNLIPELIRLARLAIILSRKYDVMITNPPYIGISTMEKSVKDYSNKYYPNSKTDMFAMFIETNFVKNNGFIAMTNMHNWMYIESFKSFRENLLKNKTIISLVHHGIKAFETIGNDVVQTCSFIIRNTIINRFLTYYVRLTDIKDYNKKMIEFYNINLHYVIDSSLFLMAEGCPFAYWVCNSFFENYKIGQKLDMYGNLPGSKNVTGNNEKYLRQFWEIDNNNIKNNYWVPYSKGGFYRKYYGNITYVADWREKALSFYEKNKTSSMLEKKYWYKKGITYSAVTSRGTAFRYFPDGYMCDGAGPVINIHDQYIYKFLGFLNSKVSGYYLSVINPTINLTKNDLKSIPYIFSNDNFIDDLVIEQIKLAKKDWSLDETTFEFTVNELVLYSKNSSLVKIEECIEKYKKFLHDAYMKFEENEYKINDIYKEIYKLNDIDFDFERRDISIRDLNVEQEIIKLISYIVGLIMGRYSFDYEGLIYAGGVFDWDKYKTIIPDKDNVIPICDDEYFDDDLCNKVIMVIKKIFGEDTLEENLQFIANTLGGSGTSREVLRNYLLNDFYNDHLKIYQKRPIYWMLDSGKKNGFKALIYMHRYTPDLLAKIRTDYVHEQQERYRTQIDNLNNEVLHLEGSNKVKVTKKLEKIKAQADELLIFEEKLHHLADQMINIDLDDGVVVNYAKFNDILYKIK